MRKLLSLAAGLLVMTSNIDAQELNAGKACSQRKISNLVHAKATVADPAEDNYDMQYVKMDLELSNTSTDIAGKVTTRARVNVASMPAYVFELNASLIIDSLKLNGQLMSVTSAGILRTVTLSSPM